MSNLTQPTLGQAMHDLARELYPICRSITGNGVRQTLALLQRVVPLEVHEVKSGQPALDWTVPDEWNIRAAWVKNARGERVIDFAQHNLHVLNYSVPIRQHMSLDELKPHLFSLPDQPDLIPYRTSYYVPNWGFCLAYRQLQALEPGEYEVCIDATLAPGSLTYGELYLPGELPDEVLISNHICHPSLANDNLSGNVLVAHLARWLSEQKRRYSYRILFIPGTIGAIVWLAQNQAKVAQIKQGLIVTNAGDPARFNYKKSRHGNAEVDRAVVQALKDSEHEFALEDFSPYGYDERQFSSPGFNLPVGGISRSPWGRFPQYHTSADNLDFIRPEALQGSLHLVQSAIGILEGNRRYLNLSPKGEPQLGKRGLYSAIGGIQDGKGYNMALLWVLNFSDGEHCLLDIAERSGLKFELLAYAAGRLQEAGLLKEIG
jgi:aminopeptidase-like protein